MCSIFAVRVLLHSVSSAGVPGRLRRAWTLRSLARGRALALHLTGHGHRWVVGRRRRVPAGEAAGVELALFRQPFDRGELHLSAQLQGRQVCGANLVALRARARTIIGHGRPGRAPAAVRRPQALAGRLHQPLARFSGGCALLARRRQARALLLPGGTPRSVGARGL